MARMRRNVLNSARLIEGESVRPGFRVRRLFVTLTYRPGVEYRPHHLESLMTSIRNWAARRGCSVPFVRVAELTKAGVPHHHVMLWLPAGLMLPKPDKRGWWPHGATKVERARNAVGYLAKYASKGTAGDRRFPRGLRVFSAGGLSPESRRVRRWWCAPLDARQSLGTAADIRKVAGGYMDRLTGSLWLSPWRVGWLPDPVSGRSALHVWRDLTPLSAA